MDSIHSCDHVPRYEEGPGRYFPNQDDAQFEKGRPTDKFPVVCTSYEMVLRDQANLSKISWEFIIIVSWNSRRSGLYEVLTHQRMKDIE